MASLGQAHLLELPGGRLRGGLLAGNLGVGGRVVKGGGVEVGEGLLGLNERVDLSVDLKSLCSVALLFACFYGLEGHGTRKHVGGEGLTLLGLSELEAGGEHLRLDGEGAGGGGGRRSRGHFEGGGQASIDLVDLLFGADDVFVDNEFDNFFVVPFDAHLAAHLLEDGEVEEGLLAEDQLALSTAVLHLVQDDFVVVVEAVEAEDHLEDVVAVGQVELEVEDGEKLSFRLKNIVLYQLDALGDLVGVGGAAQDVRAQQVLGQLVVDELVGADVALTVHLHLVPPEIFLILVELGGEAVAAYGDGDDFVTVLHHRLLAERAQVDVEEHHE
eukprot:CAMPEP_0168611778 /NCGR_PEP_ID=MMETSP0449_2-20121227/2542_1 /TAXON_ID=1082188 /ORGANISM="Strombidium rassoulzadegani, Strain ras09" /LENGTH=328 /DNA_ID=CAMNT_0008652253 /DNA_START=223 /DNA_END=1210 /DNA_ORIENTATION=-